MTGKQLTPGRRWSREDCEQLLAMKAEKKTCAEIARHFGVSEKAVIARYAREIHPEWYSNQSHKKQDDPRSTATAAWTRNGHRWTDEENATLVERRDRGDTFTDIGIIINRTNWACKIQYHALKRGTAATPGEVLATQRTTRETVNERIHEVRCEVLRYANPFGELLGEPPIGRSALDRKRMGAGA